MKNILSLTLVACMLSASSFAAVVVRTATPHRVVVTHPAPVVVKTPVVVAPVSVAPAAVVARPAVPAARRTARRTARRVSHRH